MASKPNMLLWSLAEKKYQRILSEALLRFAEAQPGRPLMIHVETEHRTYQITSQLGSLQNPAGAILICSATKPISSVLASLLLMASCFVSELVVVLLGCEAIKQESALDQLELGLRQTLAAQGLDGDSATIVRVPSKVPASSLVAAVLLALEEKQLLQAPLQEPRRLPAKHPNALLASALLELKSMLSLSSRLTQKKSNAEELFEGPITTQLGGMPYLEANEPWPTCDMFGGALTFWCQLDAREHLLPTIEGAGLYVCYVCLDREHGHFNPQVQVLHYADPNPENRKKPTPEADTKIGGVAISAYSDSVEHHCELPPLPVVNQEGVYQRFKAALHSLASPKRQLSLYQELGDILGAEVVNLKDSMSNRRDLSIGGYSGAFPPICTSCARPMRVLTNLDYQREAAGIRWPPFCLMLFLCECDLYDVQHVALEDPPAEYDRFTDDW